MAKRWTFKECRALRAIVGTKTDTLYTKRGEPRKTFPQSFWEAVSADMENMGHPNRSASSVRKKFNSLGCTIQGSLNYPKPEAVGATRSSGPVGDNPSVDPIASSDWGALELLTEFSKNVRLNEGDTVTLKYIGALNGSAVVRRKVER